MAETKIVRKRPRALLVTLSFVLVVLVAWYVWGPLSAIEGVANVVSIAVMAMCVAVLLFFLFTGVAMLIVGLLTLAGVVVSIMYFPFLFPVLIPLLIIMATVSILRR